ncbi:MAG: sulfotransferase [Bacteroidales bacterium]|nr:sulfotransferase [Bacteroidales bacterium]
MNPIFIIGIAGRSGTHYIRQLLRRHPSIGKSILNREDHFVSELNYLDLYVKNVTYYWKRDNKEHEENIKNKLKIGLGKGILSFVPTEKDKKYFLLNTPYTNNIHLFPEFFPNEKIIIITRNAKDLVESGVRSKFWNYEEGLELWNRSAKRIIEFQKKSEFQIKIVKYEDLFSNTKNQLEDIFNYLEINASDYPYEEINKIPIQGSSDGKNETNKWEYKRIEKNDNFKPLERSENWSLLRKWRFNRKCGNYSVLLNYEREVINYKLAYILINSLFDVFLCIFKIKLFLKHIIIKLIARKQIGFK